MVELDKIRKLMESSSLDDIKLGCVFLGKYKRKEIEEFMGDEGISHKCRNIPDYLPEHIISKRPKVSLVIWETYVNLNPTTNYVDSAPHPDEFF